MTVAALAPITRPKKSPTTKKKITAEKPALTYPHFLWTTLLASMGFQGFTPGHIPNASKWSKLNPTCGLALSD